MGTVQNDNLRMLWENFLEDNKISNLLHFTHSETNTFLSDLKMERIAKDVSCPYSHITLYLSSGHSEIKMIANIYFLICEVFIDGEKSQEGLSDAFVEFTKEPADKINAFFSAFLKLVYTDKPAYQDRSF